MALDSKQTYALIFVVLYLITILLSKNPKRMLEIEDFEDGYDSYKGMRI